MSDLLPVYEYAPDAEISPCPFCGHETDGVDREMVEIGDEGEHDLPAYFVVCGWCFAQGPIVEAGADVDLPAYQGDPQNLTSAQAVLKCIELWNGLQKREGAIKETSARIAYRMGRQDQQRFVEASLRKKTKGILIGDIPSHEWIAQEAESFPGEPASFAAIVREAETHCGAPGEFDPETSYDGELIKEGEITAARNVVQFKPNKKSGRKRKS